MASRTYSGLELLPIEIFETVCSHLTKHDVSQIAGTSRFLYALCQDPLYRHPVLPSYSKLFLFVRSLNQFHQQQAKRIKWWREDGKQKFQSKTIKTLKICIDGQYGNEGQMPTAAVIARLISAVVGHSPTVEITLQLTHFTCQALKYLNPEEFKRVVRLVVYVGLGDADQTRGLSPHEARRVRERDARGCDAKSSSTFWEPFINGMAFPHLRDVSIDHFSPAPRDDTSLYAGNEATSSSGYMWHNPGPPFSSLTGLSCLERLSLFSMSHVEPTTLERIFMNNDVIAGRLKCLELRFCSLPFGLLGVLMRRSLPVLDHFVLHVNSDSIDAHRAKDNLFHGSDGSQELHLCPLIRDYGKNIKTLDVALPWVCREIFLTDVEKTKLDSVGVAVVQGKELDAAAVRSTILESRAARAENVKSKRRAQGIPDYKLATEERDRKELIRRECWKRQIVAWRGMCRHEETWDELVEEADLEEDGVEWVTVNVVEGKAHRRDGNGIKEQLDVPDVIGGPEATLQSAHQAIASDYYSDEDGEQDDEDEDYDDEDEAYDDADMDGGEMVS